MARPATLHDRTFREAVLDSGASALVFFWASWNATCKAAAPSVTQLAEEYEGRVLVAKLDVDANPVSPAKLGITTVPCFGLFAGGALRERVVGYRKIEVLRQLLDDLLSAAV